MKQHHKEKSPEVPDSAPSAPLPSTNGTGNVTVKQTSPGGNGAIWCSGPLAPGWNVSLPNGGCEKMSATSTAYGLEKPTHVRLDQLPYSGTSDVAIYTVLFGAIVFSIVMGHYLSRALSR